MKTKKILLRIALPALIVGLLLFYFFSRGSSSTLNMKTVKVSKGDVEVTVSATGTIQAIQTVEVGTQVSGTIDKLYVDFNSEVKKGQLLAVLDTKPLQLSLTMAYSQLESAKAEVQYQQANYDREKILFNKNLSTQSDFDQAEYNLAKAKASLSSASAEYQKASTNLNYAYIYSPIDGVVLDKAVEIGQTVAASFSTPTLFTIVNDLTQMQVEANIDEADIGMIKKGQQVSFSVDAFSDDTFTGIVTEVRLNPVTTSNVVTYVVIISAPNPDKKLMPGMTANIEIEIEHVNQTTCVPSEALQFVPDQTMIDVYSAQLTQSEQSEFSEAMNDYKKLSGSSTKTVVWVKSGKIMKPVTVETGIDNGILVEIKKGNIKPGDVLVTGFTEEAVVEESATSGESPFMPTPPKRK